MPVRHYMIATLIAAILICTLDSYTGSNAVLLKLYLAVIALGLMQCIRLFK